MDERDWRIAIRTGNKWLETTENALLWRQLDDMMDASDSRCGADHASEFAGGACSRCILTLQSVIVAHVSLIGQRSWRRKLCVQDASNRMRPSRRRTRNVKAMCQSDVSSRWHELGAHSSGSETSTARARQFESQRVRSAHQSPYVKTGAPPYYTPVIVRFRYQRTGYLTRDTRRTDNLLCVKAKPMGCMLMKWKRMATNGGEMTFDV